MTAPPLIYFGGKTLLAPKIAHLLPEHRHYVEPFAGGLSVLLAKTPAAMETVNDLNRHLMTFWRVLRDRPADLERACALTPHSRAEHQDSYDRDGCDELEIARRVWVTLTQGRGGVMLRTGWRHRISASGAALPTYLDGYVGRLGAVAERLHHVSLECRPALEVIDAYGRAPEVLLYVDPPYLGSTRDNTRRYEHEMLGESEHAVLLAALRECRAAVVVSGYPSPKYDEALAGWDRRQFVTGTGQSARGEWSARTEVLWSNRPFRGEPGLFDGHEVAS